MANEKRLIWADDALAAEFTIEEGGAIAYVVDSEVIRRLPTVDAVEVVHGWWITVESREYLGVRCSNCQKWFDEKTNYCPNCGARMKEGNENG